MLLQLRKTLSCTWATWNRKGHSADAATYDMNWTYHTEWSVFNHSFPEGSYQLPKPSAFDKMMEVAAKLSSGFPVVRVDLYEVDGKVYFGELTFTSLGGFMDFYSQEFLDMCPNCQCSGISVEYILGILLWL